MSTYPKEIPLLETETEIDVTGFTSLEKVTLTNAWRVIKPKLRIHSTEIFLDFFIENENLLGKFRDSNDKFEMAALHSHPLWVLNTIGSLIEEGLQDVVQMNVIMLAVTHCHRHRRVDNAAIALLAVAVNRHLKLVLLPLMSPTLEIALDKMCELITQYHKD